MGEPTEAALLEMVLKTGGGFAKPALFYREEEIPFDSTRKLMSVGVKSSEAGSFVFVKGAPAHIVQISSYYLSKNSKQLRQNYP